MSLLRRVFGRGSPPDARDTAAAEDRAGRSRRTEGAADAAQDAADADPAQDAADADGEMVAERVADDVAEDVADDERGRELALHAEDAARLADDLLARQHRYAARKWTPPAQGGVRRADDAERTDEGNTT